MSYRSSTDLDIASRALVMIGTKPINSFEDETVEANTARLLYEDVAAASLVSTTWRFTIVQRKLNRLASAPVGRGELAFEVPADCLQIRAVTLDDHAIAFERYENIITTRDIGPDAVPVMEFARRTETSAWPAYFVPIVQHMLASEFAIAIAQNEQLSNLHAQKAEILLRSGKSMDSQGRTNSVMNTKRFIGARR